MLPAVEPKPERTALSGKEDRIAAGDGVSNDGDGLISKELVMLSKATASSNNSSKDSGFGDVDRRRASAATLRGLFEGAEICSAGTTSSSGCGCVGAMSKETDSEDSDGSKSESLLFKTSLKSSIIASGGTSMPLSPSLRISSQRRRLCPIW